MRTPAILAGACVIGTGGAAVANPIMVIDEAYAQQFPHTVHVQLTQEKSMSRPSTMSITRDGQVVTATTLRSATTSADLGSGVDDIYWVMACDCNVPIGQHSYNVGGKTLEVDVVDAAAATGALYHFSASCDTECSSVDPVPPEGGSGGGGAGGAAGEAGAEPGVTAGGVSGASGAGGVAETSGGTMPMAGVGGTVPMHTGGAPATGGAATGGLSATAAGAPQTGGEATGGTAPATGGTAPATGGTQSVIQTADTGGTIPEAPATGGSDSSSAGAADTDGNAPEAPTANKRRDSSSCAVSRTRGRATPFGILAALWLLAWRRRK
ncbi:MAG: hypothetical protein JW940_22495 [Polyangiaceae bacterium]|nr:hypothetical protein [Polyangiaceae bacterium]